MAVFVVLARLLDPEDFGIIAIALAILSFVEVFVVAGFAEALVQRLDLRPDHIASAFWISTFAGVVIGGTFLVLAPSLANLFDTPSLAPVIRVLAFGFVLIGVSSTPKALLQRQLDFRSIAARSVIGSVVGGAAAIVAAVLGAGIWSLVVQSMTDLVVGALILWLSVSFRPTLGPSWSAARELIGFSLYSLGTQFVNFFHRRSDDLVIGWRLGPQALGLYSMGYRLMRLVDDMVSKVLFNVAFPAFALIQDQRLRSQRAFLAATEVSAVAIFPAFVGMSICAPEIITVAFGRKWDRAAPVMAILALAGMLQGVQHLARAVLKAAGRADANFRVGVLISVVSVTVFFAASPYGIVAVAAAYTVASYAVAPLVIFMACRQLEASPRQWVAAIAGPVVAVAIMAVSVLAVRVALSSQEVEVRLATSVVVGGLSYLAALRVVAHRAWDRSMAFAREAVQSLVGVTRVKREG